MSAVVVTGIGLVTPLGAGREQTWENLVAGRSGIRPTPRGLEAGVQGVSANGARSRAGDFAVLAAAEALLHAGLDPAAVEVGCAIGQSKPLFDPRDPSLLLASFTGWSLEAAVKSHLGLNGPSANVAAACATGVAALETAAAWIRSGVCEVALAGAAEASLHDFYRAGFDRLGVLAGGDDPALVRPFDAGRDGFAMGEGAAVMVLESDAFRRRRGASAIAALRRTALRQSATDPLRFDEDGRAVAALARAAAAGETPTYVNAHGTGTPLNDAAEARGLSEAFAGAENFFVGSTKASTGHLLGAAGAVEAAFAALAVHRGVMPPSLNVTTPDPLCRFSLAGASGRKARVRSAMSLSYGFGGQMAAVVFGEA